MHCRKDQEREHGADRGAHACRGDAGPSRKGPQPAEQRPSDEEAEDVPENDRGAERAQDRLSRFARWRHECAHRTDKDAYTANEETGNCADDDANE